MKSVAPFNTSIYEKRTTKGYPKKRT